MKVQDAIEVMSERKRFHVIVFALLALNFMFIPIHIFVDLFLSYEPKHYCAYPQGGSKYQWIPYNHETHAFESCAIYEEPLSKALAKEEKARIERESYHKDVKVWDWKALKFKSKHYHHKGHDDEHDDNHDNHHDLDDHADYQVQDHKGPETETLEDHRRRRREQPRPPATESDSPGGLHRLTTADGRVLEPSEVKSTASDVMETPVDVTDASQTVTSAPTDAAHVSKDVTESPVLENEDIAVAGDEEPAVGSETEVAPPPSDAKATSEASEDHDEDIDPEDDRDRDVDEEVDSSHSDEEVHSFFEEADGERLQPGSGATDSVVPEYDISDELNASTSGDDDVVAKDNSRGNDEDTTAEELSEAVVDDSVESVPDRGTERVMVPHDADEGHGVDQSGRDSGSASGNTHSNNQGDNDVDHGASSDNGDGDAARSADLTFREVQLTYGDDDDDDDGDDDEDDHEKGHNYKDDELTKSPYGSDGYKKYLHKTSTCEHGIHYLADVGTTLITDYGLSCSNDVSVITNTVLGTAMVAGAIIFAPFVDKYGRKTLFMMVCCQNCLISLGIAFVRDIRSYWVLRFLSRFYIEGVEIALLVLAVEMAPSKSRPIAPLILYVAYAFGQILLSLQAMLFRSWWKLQLAISVESILLIPFSWFLMPESIQWLVSMRRHQEAEKLIRLGCRLNGIILPSDFKLDKVEHEDGEGSDDEATGNGHAHGPRKSAAERLRSTQLNLKNRPGTGEYLQHEFHAHIGEWRKILDLMKNHQLRRHFFIVSYMWAIVGFLYYGLTASTMVMKGNVYLNYCLSGLVMVPASVSIFILRRFGRKKPIFYFLIGAGIFIILSVICPYKTPDGVDMYPVYLAIKLMAKYCVVSCLISIRLLIIELFPTPVRGTLIGLTALIGLLGSALGYYFLELITFSKWVGVVVGALTIFAAILSRMLPETSHRPLPDTINDMMAACREMFLNLLVAMPNMPRQEPPAPTPQPRPKRNLSALSAFSAVLSWRSRSKAGGAGDGGPVRSMSDEDFKRAPHPPLSSMTSSPLPRGDDVAGEVGERSAPALKSLVHRVRETDQPQRPSLRERMSRALSQKRPGGDRLTVAPRRERRSSSTPSLATAASRCGGFDNPQYERDTPKVSFDLVRADSQGLASNGLEGGLATPGVGEGERGTESGQGPPSGQTDAGEGGVQATTHL